MDYNQFKAWFEQNYAQLALPQDCTEIQRTTELPGSAVIWTFRWCLKFADGKYLQIKEHYTKQSGLLDSRRSHFTYHYGPIVREQPDGIPEGSHEDPVDIRIDTSGGSVHMHHGASEPHYGQDRVDGLDMLKLDMFKFVGAVLKHRASGKLIKNTFGFKVK